MINSYACNHFENPTHAHTHAQSPSHYFNLQKHPKQRFPYNNDQPPIYMEPHSIPQMHYLYIFLVYKTTVKALLSPGGLIYFLQS